MHEVIICEKPSSAEKIAKALSSKAEKKLYNILIKNKKLFSQLTMDNLLTGILQKRLAQAVMKAGGLQDF